MNRKLPLAAAAIILAGIAYCSWPRPESAIETATNVSPPLPPAVPFLVRAKVATILEQQQRVAAAGSSGDVAAAETRIRLAAKDIRTRLVSDGVHQDSAMLEIVRAAALQSGLGVHQVDAVAEAFQAGSKKLGQPGFVGGARKALEDITGLPQAAPTAVD